jgi:hypothetical protein
MDLQLAARLPDVKTYRAQGLDERAASARLDLTPEGFHGFILSPAGAVYIDPYARGNTQHYMSYWRRDYARSGRSEGGGGVAHEQTKNRATTTDRTGRMGGACYQAGLESRARAPKSESIGDEI